MRRISVVLAVVLLACGIAAAPRFLSSHTTSGNDFVHFESPHVHPAALTPSNHNLLVVNTPGTPAAPHAVPPQAARGEHARRPAHGVRRERHGPAPRRRDLRGAGAGL